MDTDTTIAELRQAVGKFVEQRDWNQYHTPKNLSMSIAIEAAELMEPFQWLSNEESQALVKEPKAQAEAADELADILIYCLSFANQADIDISEAVLAKLARNQTRFPIGAMPSGKERG